MEAAVIGLILLEIVLSGIGIYYTIHDGNLQDDLLKRALRAQQKVDTDLGDVNSKLGGLNSKIDTTVGRLDDLNGEIKIEADNVARSTAISKKMSDGMTAQLHLIDQQFALQKQEFERENQHPTVAVYAYPQGSEGHPPTRHEIEPGTGANTGHSLTGFSPGFGPAALKGQASYIGNVGDARLRHLRVSAVVNSPSTVECVAYGGLITIYSQNPCEFKDVRPPDLELRKEINVTVWMTVPQDAQKVDIAVTVSGDDLLDDSYSLLVLP
jgi:hypothetical protein